ncbi:MAG: hypothetical protein AAF958_09140 [Planctomycetota bacterium]
MNQLETGSGCRGIFSLLRFGLAGIAILVSFTAIIPECKAQLRKATKLRKLLRQPNVRDRNGLPGRKPIRPEISLPRAELDGEGSDDLFFVLLENRNSDEKLARYQQVHRMVKSSVGKFTFADIRDQRFTDLPTEEKQILESYGNLHALVAAAAIYQHILDVESVITKLRSQVLLFDDASTESGGQIEAIVNDGYLDSRLTELVADLHPSLSMPEQSRLAIVEFLRQPRTDSDSKFEKKLFETVKSNLQQVIGASASTIASDLRMDTDALGSVLRVNPRFSLPDGKLMPARKDRDNRPSASQLKAFNERFDSIWLKREEDVKSDGNMNANSIGRVAEKSVLSSAEIEQPEVSKNPPSLNRFIARFKKLSRESDNIDTACEVLHPETTASADTVSVDEIKLEGNSGVHQQLIFFVRLKEQVKEHGNEPHEDVLQNLSCLVRDEPDELSEFRIAIARRFISAGEFEKAMRWLPGEISEETKQTVVAELTRVTLNQIDSDFHGEALIGETVDIAAAVRKSYLSNAIARVRLNHRIALAESIYIQAFWLEAIERLVPFTN